MTSQRQEEEALRQRLAAWLDACQRVTTEELKGRCEEATLLWRELGAVGFEPPDRIGLLGPALEALSPHCATVAPDCQVLIEAYSRYVQGEAIAWAE